MVVLDDVHPCWKSRRPRTSFTLYSGLSARSRPLLLRLPEHRGGQGCPPRPAPSHSPRCRFHRGTPSVSNLPGAVSLRKRKVTPALTTAWRFMHVR